MTLLFMTVDDRNDCRKLAMLLKSLNLQILVINRGFSAILLYFESIVLPSLFI